MAVVATDWVGGDVVCSDAVPLIRRAVTNGTLVVFTDTAMTQGCPGRADSEESLLDSALAWMRDRGGALSCIAMQLGFDAGGRPRLVLAVSDADGSACGRDIWRSSDETVQVDASPCTLVTFTDLAGGSRFAGGYDDDIELLAAMRSWVKRHPDFACDAVQMAHDETGRPQVVLAGAGCTVQ
jgi:hypothetical protein